MDIKKHTWLLVWTLVWGIPTGLLFAAIATIVKSDDSISLQNFQSDIFIQRSLMCVPVFVVIGFVLGIISYQRASKASRGG